MTNVSPGTGMTVLFQNTAEPQVSINGTCRNTWNSSYTTVKELSTCPGLDCEGVIESISISDGLESTGGANPTLGIASSCNTKWDQSGCSGLLKVGTVTSVGGTGGLTSTGGATPSLSIDADCNTKWDQSGCLGINCEGTISEITAGTGATVLFGTTSPQVSINGICRNTWNSSYTTVKELSSCAGLDCEGTMTSVSVSDGLETTGGNAPTLGIATSCNTKWDQSGCAGLLKTGTMTSVSVSDGLETTGGNAPTLGIATACNTKWDQSGCLGINCQGTMTGVSVSDGLESTGGNAPTLGIATACNTKWDQSGCDGLDCVGDITAVIAGVGLSATTLAGDAELGIDSGALAYLDQSGCLGLDCEGTISSVTAGTGATVLFGTTTPQISINGICRNTWNSSYTTVKELSSCAGLDCEGTMTSVSVSDGLETTGGNSPTLGIATACNTKWDQSGCAGLLKTGTMTGISVSDGLESTGGNSPTLGIATACNTKWDQSGCLGIDCEGTINSITAGTGATVLFGTTTPQISINGICNTTWNSAYTTTKSLSTCPGLDCEGTMTSVSVSDGLETTGGNSPTLGIASACNTKWDQSGCSGLTCTGTLKPSGTIATNDFARYNSSGCLVGLNCGETRSALGINTAANCTAASLDQSGCAGLLCEGDVTGIDAGTGITVTDGTTATPEVSIDSACDTKWNAKGTLCDAACDGTLYGRQNGVWTSLAGLDQSGALGLNCVGDITAVFAGSGLSGTALAGDASIGINSGTLTPFDQSGCAGLDCTGTVVASDISSFTSCTGNLCGATAQCIFDTAENFCIGPNAGEDFTSGGNNVLIGQCAGRCITTGSHNISMGFRAGEKTSDKGCNVSLGRCANFCGQGCANTAIGPQAMQNSTASNSIGIGKCTLLNATGNSNTAIGAQALQGITTGQQNFGLGAIAGFSMQTGNGNVFIGEQAHRYATGGDNNIAIGKYAGRCHSGGTKTAGSNSIFIGQDARAGAANVNNEIVIGCGAVGCGSNKAMIGNSSITVVCSNGTFSTVSDIRDKTCICDLELGLDFIGDLQPKTFNMVTDRNDPEGSISCKRHGFIAQDVIAIEGDDNVIINNDNPDRLGYTGEHIIPILVKAVQELKAEIEELKK